MWRRDPNIIHEMQNLLVEMDDNEIAEEGVTNPLDLFVNECNDLDAEVRISSIKKLATVAVALDAEKTRTELMPYLEDLTESIYNDDEILMNLAEQLVHFVPFVGGIEHVESVLCVLEKLAAVEENIVREKAIESLKKISEELNDDDLEHKFVPLVFGMTESEWFTSKCSSPSLLTVCYPRVSDEIRAEIRRVFELLCKDESPLVRRSFGGKLGDFIKVLELQYLKEQFIPISETFSKDEQDSVRLLAVDISLNVALRLTQEEVDELVVNTITELSCDSSWRVRYQVANKICEIQTAFGHDLTRKYLVLIYQNLINDAEPQVREASAKCIVRFCELLQETHQANRKDEDDQLDPVILQQIFPLIQTLDQDNNPDVKEALSSVITAICPLLGLENTKLLLLPLITASLMNDSSRVKENIISNLNNIISVIGLADIADTVLQIIVDLVNNSASVWRTRRNLIVTINYIAKHSGSDYFDTHLKPLYQKLLNDGVYAVRKTAPLILPILIKNFGFEWAKGSILTNIWLFAEHKHYLYRYVCLFCIDELVSPTLEAKCVEENRLRYLQQLIGKDDENIRIFLNTLRKLNNRLQRKFKQEWVKNTIEATQNELIPEDDIKKYTEDTINMFVTGNNLSILSVRSEDVLIDDVYLEGLLELAVGKFFDVLKRLAEDPVENVQSLVGRTLMRIRDLCTALDSDFQSEQIKVFLMDECESEEEKEISDDNKSMEEEMLEILDEKLKA
ncbi:hypothetical protein PPYR_07550 [Photinus pyralis]|uniref:Phosphatase PP2A regulatory subunit A/Splicing factor 3B subunit 1-like HEAT repeat domain-containing protein n=1 Tax=Photinus pyralis TaxID=7054 RepID=A0A5N4AQR5_PHOPY|nr:serine/threonine-protein phosphatase 2A 65 kDa regulatory subunit A alpha isoform-like isoform X2 [Photinus pyralis]KAB0799670.1 hypothetical protein PPYR_07550 [Photinus pyralis]